MLPTFAVWQFKWKNAVNKSNALRKTTTLTVLPQHHTNHLFPKINCMCDRIGFVCCFTLSVICANIEHKSVTGTQAAYLLVMNSDWLHGCMVCYMGATDIWALPFQTHRRRKAAEQRELSAEHYRACWELLSVAPWKGLPGVDGKSVGRHRRNSVWYWNWSLVHLLGKEVRGRGGAQVDSTIYLKQKPDCHKKNLYLCIHTYYTVYALTH